MTFYTPIIDQLSKASDNQLDTIGVSLVKQWSDPPSSEQILELLDNCVCFALCSDFVVTVLETLLDRRMKEEGKTRDEVVAGATWRETLLP